MKMIRAIIRPEKEQDIISALENEGFISLTKIDVFGRGKQKGIRIGDIHYAELPKTMLMLVVLEEEAEKAINVISDTARTGSFGDGKIFITDVSESYTIRTGECAL